ncbi:MAG TPA: ABC transporter permease [Thermomicrobiaceae bacterium]|nr:ABC transporter permease [Thermomicrobiaceae bacterium]
MSRRRILALATRIIKQLRHDPRTLVEMLLIPVLILSLLAYIYRGATHHESLAVVNPAPSALSTQITDALRADATLDVRAMSAAEADRALRAGDVDAVLSLPPNLSVAPGGPAPEVTVTLEGSQPNATGAVLTALNRALPEAVVRAVSPAGLPLQLSPRFLHGGPQYDQLDYFAPVFIGFFALFFVFLLTSVSFLRERIQGSIERLMASPLSRGEIVLGYMLGFSLFAAIQSAVIVLFAVEVLRIHYAGHLWLVFLVALMLTLGAVNLGIFLSTFARTELQVVQFIPLVITPQGLLSGIIWPIATLPGPLRLLAYAMPLTYANNALRGVMIRGDGLAALGVDLLVLAGFALLMLVLATSTLRREIA